MVTEAELLDTFDLDELDDTQHPCMVVLFSTATGYLRSVVDDLVAEGKKADGKVWANGVPVISTDLTINEMQTLAGRWSCIRSIEPNRVITL